MCRNIRTLYNFDPPATEAEIEAAALQFVRKPTGFNQPRQVNAEPFFRAVEELSQTASRLLAGLETRAPAKNREHESRKRQEKNIERFGR
ncbi:MAG: hypothetical protein ACI82A_001722 [Candidatus Azotimanducaceae bacterium]|jgi:hypothetical protein